MLVPKGLFEIDEETNEPKYAEDFAMPKSDELKSLEAWSHGVPLIFESGRCSHYIPAHLDEEAREELQNKLSEEEKQEEFRAINEDTPISAND